jgi:hypothetical protein
MPWRTKLDMYAGKVTVRGAAYPASEVVAWSDSFIAIKIPGHSYWVGRGMKQAYAKQAIMVLTYEDGWWYRKLEW